MCGTKRKLKSVDPETKRKLEDGYRKLQDARNCKSLLKKHLTEAVFDKLRKRRTDYGSTLWEVIASGVENLDSGIGVYAPDPDAYGVFADLFDPIIQEYHGGFRPTDNHPAKDWGDVNAIQELDPDGEYVVSTRVRCGRSIEGYGFNPSLTEEDYRQIEANVSHVLKKLTGEYRGTYYPLIDMNQSTRIKLTEDHFLFKEGDRFLQAAGACRFWPTGRGIFHNQDKTFLVWVNEEDHLRIISMQMGGDLGAVYRRLVGGVNAMRSKFPFSRSEHLGYLTFCPTNLGTTIRASVHIKLPKLSRDFANMEKIAAEYNLQIRGTSGEHTSLKGSVFDISNKRRLGLTEFEAVKEMQDGVIELIKLERSL